MYFIHWSCLCKVGNCVKKSLYRLDLGNYVPTNKTLILEESLTHVAKNFHHDMSCDMTSSYFYDKKIRHIPQKTHVDDSCMSFACPDMYKTSQQTNAKKNK